MCSQQQYIIPVSADTAGAADISRSAVSSASGVLQGGLSALHWQCCEAGFGSQRPVWKWAAAAQRLCHFMAQEALRPGN